MSTPVIDTHTHFIPNSLADASAMHPAWGVSVDARDGRDWVVHNQGFTYPLDPTFVNVEAKLRDMDDRRVAMSLLSLAPPLFLYGLSGADGEAFASWANDELAAAVTHGNGRLAGIATLPMQAPAAAAEELRRCVEDLALVGAQIGSNIEGAQLDDPRFAPVLEAAEALDVPLMLHPYYTGSKPGLEDYYLTNIFGNPLDTALAGARLIFSGALDRYPDLDVILVHAGGFLPYQLGRLDHGWTVRSEPKVDLKRKPSELFTRFTFDSITHNDEALRWLLEFAGSERVVVGTDLPYDMGDGDPVGRLERVAESPAVWERVAAQNAVELFGLAVPTSDEVPA